MKIAMDAGPLAEEQPTGVAWFVDHLAHEVAKQHDVRGYLISARSAQRLRTRAPHLVPALRRRLPVPTSRMRARWRAGKGPDARWWVGLDVDIIHATNFFLPPSSRAGKVLTVHDLAQLHCDGLSGQVSTYVDDVGAAIDHGAFVHTLSEAVARDVLDHLGADPDRVRVVPPGPPDRHPPVPRPEQTPWPYLVVIGTLEPRKRVPRLIQLFEEIAGQVPDLHLVIVGSTALHRAGAEAVAAAQENCAFRERVHSLGYVVPGLRDALVQHAVALVVPSLYEGYGIPLLEAFNVGTPVVASAVGGVLEVAGVNGAARLVDVDDGEGLVKAIVELVSDDRLAARMAEAGRARVDELSWTRTIDAMTDLYSTAAEAAGRTI